MDTALFADKSARTVRGLLLPFDELSATPASGNDPIMFSAGTVELPADPAAFIVNEGHSQFAPRGHALSLSETPAGIVAEFAIAKTPEGDALLDRCLNPDETQRPRLSAEVFDIARNGVRAISAKLTGAAFVERGAFASAGLFELGTAPADAAASVDPAAPAADPSTLTPEQLAEVDALVTARIQEALTTPTPQDPTATIGTFGEETMTAAAALAALAGGTPTPETTDGTTLAGLYSAMAEFGTSKDAAALAPFARGAALFAIQTVQNDGPTGKTIGADTAAPQFLQELQSRQPYVQKFLPLFNQAALTSLTGQGWRWVDGKRPEVDEYAGNTAEIPSNNIDTEPVPFTAKRIAGGHKLDRRFIDFGDTSVYASYFDQMAQSYMRKVDYLAVADAVAGATALTAGSVPAGIAKGLVSVVDGYLSVDANENTPAFALIESSLWREIILTPKDDVLGYLNAALGLTSGDLAGFRLIPTNRLATAKVLVGAASAMTVYQLPGSPMRVEGIDPHHGAVDPALFGYYASVVNAPKALALVTPAA